MAIAELLDDLNARTMRRVGRSRQDLFEEVVTSSERELTKGEFEKGTDYQVVFLEKTEGIDVTLSPDERAFRSPARLPFSGVTLLAAGQWQDA